MALVIRWVLDSWSNDTKKLASRLGPLLECLCLINCAYLKEMPSAPLLYRAGLRYQRERTYRDPRTGEIRQQEDWRDYPAILRHGGGDCEDLACARVAEQRVRFGQPARPIVSALWVEKPSPHWLYHITVGLGSSREDPSRILGMGASELANFFPEIP